MSLEAVEKLMDETADAIAYQKVVKAVSLFFFLKNNLSGLSVFKNVNLNPSLSIVLLIIIFLLFIAADY